MVHLTSDLYSKIYSYHAIDLDPLLMREYVTISLPIQQVGVYHDVIYVLQSINTSQSM